MVKLKSFFSRKLNYRKSTKEHEQATLFSIDTAEVESSDQSTCVPDEDSERTNLKESRKSVKGMKTNLPKEKTNQNNARISQSDERKYENHVGNIQKITNQVLCGTDKDIQQMKHDCLVLSMIDAGIF